MHEHHHRHHRHEEFQPGRQRWEGPGAGPEREPRPGRRGHHHRGGPRGRAQRGDVRAAVLILLGEEPMHGYQLMQAIAERTNGAWKVSPGAIYPTLALLEDEGLVSTESAGGRKLATLTESGRALLADPDTAPTDPFEAMTESGRVSGREIFEALAMASRTIARTGSKAQIEAARAVLERARRELYLILADGPADEPQS
ncbi:MAG TPA: PadR family transcriptional regulator [Sporichthyaceae bacterium]|jgi:DNA-binding PadR family transcriptional regulator